MKKTKVVNIYPTMPITRINPPIRSSVKNVTKSIEEIRTCLMARAVVEEVTPNGIIRLDNTNYDKDNVNTCTTHHECACGLCGAGAAESVPAVDNSNTESSIWDKAYNDAIAGVDLASMTRKQRRAAEASARDAANKAVAEAKKNEEDVENDSAEVETVEVTDVNTEVTNDTSDENSVITEEAPVETIDIEKASVDSVE